MKILVEILCVVLALPVCAFDSDAWLAKRAAHGKTARELKAVYDELRPQCDAPADKVSVPVEQYDDGSVKLLLEADKMQFFLQSGYIYGEGVKITKFDEERRVTAYIKASSCVVDRNKKRGWAEGRIEAMQDRTEMRGDSAYFSSPDDYVQMYGDVYMKSLDLNFGGMR